MTPKTKPNWAGEDWLSRCVNVLIRTKPLYGLMKYQARQVMIKTAEKNDIPWRARVASLDASAVKTLLDQFTDPQVAYPDYYNVPFHAYDAGNLCWSAAFEAESATYSMALRCWPDDNLKWDMAHQRLRGSFHQVLAEYGPAVVNDVLDLGCSVGVSTIALHRFYAEQQEHPVQTMGLDLSPYMLSVAHWRDQQREIKEWRHARAEETGLADQSFDLVTLQHVIHELPRTATRAVFAEALRLLRPGGYLAVVDNNPQSPVIQNLPPVLFTLMKSTEPWTDDYYTFDVEAAMQAVGFEHLATVANDPRHRTMVARKPT